MINLFKIGDCQNGAVHLLAVRRVGKRSDFVKLFVGNIVVGKAQDPARDTFHLRILERVGRVLVAQHVSGAVFIGNNAAVRYGKGAYDGRAVGKRYGIGVLCGVDRRDAPVRCIVDRTSHGRRQPQRELFAVCAGFRGKIDRFRPVALDFDLGIVVLYAIHKRARFVHPVHVDKGTDGALVIFIGSRR